MSSMLDTAILLTAETLRPFVDAWRGSVLADAIPPHITLLSPWANPADDEAAVRRLADVASACTPFELVFREVGTFPTGTVFLRPDAGGLAALLDALMSAFPEYPPYGGEFDALVPHLSVSRCGGTPVAAEVTAALADQGGSLRADVREISTWELLADGRWKLLRSFALGTDDWRSDRVGVLG